MVLVWGIQENRILSIAVSPVSLGFLRVLRYRRCRGVLGGTPIQCCPIRGWASIEQRLFPEASLPRSKWKLQNRKWKIVPAEVGPSRRGGSV